MLARAAHPHEEQMNARRSRLELVLAIPSTGLSSRDLLRLHAHSRADDCDLHLRETVAREHCAILHQLYFHVAISTASIAHKSEYLTVPLLSLM